MPLNVGQTIFGIGSPSSFTVTSFDFSSSGNNTVISGVANQTIRVFRIFLVVSASTVLTFKNGTTNLTGGLSMSANGGITFDLANEMWFYCTAGNAFIINQSGSAQIGGTVWFQQS